MTLRIAMLGDIVGTPGRQAVKQLVPKLRQEHGAQLVIANAENAANGTGLTPELYRKLCDAGVDAVTLGDHVYKKKQIVGTLERETNVIRPVNLPPAAKGRGWMRIPVPAPALANLDTTPTSRAGSGPSVYVVTVLGRIFIHLPAGDPFAAIDRVLREIPENAVVIVEVHAEATSEKRALGWYLNGRVTAVLGTHTHVPTGDAQILPRVYPRATDALTARPPAKRLSTAYITDLGMTGPYDSILGRSVDPVVEHMTTAMPVPFDVATGDPRACGVLLDVDPETGHALSIEPFQLKADVNAPPFI